MPLSSKTLLFAGKNCATEEGISENSIIMFWNPAKVSGLKPFQTQIQQNRREEKPLNLIWVPVLMDRLETFTCQIFMFGLFLPF